MALGGHCPSITFQFYALFWIGIQMSRANVCALFSVDIISYLSFLLKLGDIFFHFLYSFSLTEHCNCDFIRIVSKKTFSNIQNTVLRSIKYLIIILVHHLKWVYYFLVIIVPFTKWMNSSLTSSLIEIWSLACG